MSAAFRSVAPGRARAVLVIIVGVLAAGWTAAGWAQNNGVVGTFNAVGGVSVDAGGAMKNIEIGRRGQFDKIRLEAAPGAMGQAAELRKVSLTRLHAALKEQLDSGKPASEAMQCLAGLQEIRYVLVYPEEHDIVLAGPAEGWKLDRRGNVVGAANGKPVLLLDDLLTALRAACGNVRSVMSCSIDPTPEGLQRLSAMARRLQPGMDPGETAANVEEQLGPQKITVAGVPETSRFARVMVAADYRMKRISMGLEPAPVRGLPAFLDLMQGTGRGMSNMLPRWWLEPNFAPLVRDEAGLSWELRGATVRAMAETDFFDAHGIQHPTGKADPVGQRWATMMTQRYEELAAADPIFGQLRNCMDLAVVAALVAHQDLAKKAGVSLPLLTGADGLPTAKLDAPKQVASKSSVVHKKKWMIAAGGVSINPWKAVENIETRADLAKVRQATEKGENAWWWD